MAQEILVGHGFLIIRASRSHSDTLHTERILRTNDQPDTETSAWQHTTLTTDRQTDMPPVELGPAVPATERPQTHALDRAATGISYEIKAWGITQTTTIQFNWLPFPN